MSQPTLFAWHMGSSVRVKLLGLHDPEVQADPDAPDTYINDATVTFTLYNPDGSTSPAGISFPASMAYDSGSNGDYIGTVDGSLLTLDEGENYIVSVLAVSGSLKKEWRTTVLAEYDDN